jgi:protocatechuate 3,4-dioxygenase beta subunit
MAVTGEIETIIVPNNTSRTDLLNPILGTDKPDYHPAEIAIITGSGFAVNTDYLLVVTAEGQPSQTYNIVSDSTGNFTYSYQLFDTYIPNYKVELTSFAGLILATTTFTDTVDPNWVCVNDSQGVDDVPGQKDLNEMCFDDSMLPTNWDISWNWDDASWSGGNSGDACALFDSNGDGKANFAYCLQVGGDPALELNTYLYSCNDSRSDRCAGKSLINSNDYCNVNLVTDSFASTVPSHSLLQDTKGVCVIPNSLIGNSNSITMLDVCSYPSGEPNSDPSDCIRIPTQSKTGKIELIKSLIPNNDQGKFSLYVNGTIHASNIGNSGTTGEVIVIEGTSTVQELAGTATNLADYSTGIICKDNNGGGSIIAQSTNTGPLNVPVSNNDDILCTITNTRNARCGDGNIDTGETCDNGASNGNVCTPPYGTNGTPESCSYCSSTCQTITLTDGYCGDNIKNGPEECDGTSGLSPGYSCSNTCTLIRDTGTITVDKVTKPSEDTTNFPFTVVSTETNTNESFNLSDQSTPWSMTLPTGVYTVSEGTLPTGWSLSNTSCISDQGTPITGTFGLDKGENVTCTFTNTKKGSISGTKWEDMNGDGDKDAEDLPISGWTIKLDKYADGTFETTTTTDANGKYVFDNLIPENYKIMEVAPMGPPWNQSYPSAGYQYSVNLLPGDNLTGKDFGNYLNGQIKGYKWEDVNGDGNKEASEGVPTSQWQIKLWKEVNGIPVDQGSSVYTDPGTGAFSFGVSPGTYYLSEVLQTAGWTQTQPANGSKLAPDGVTRLLGPIIVTSGSISENNNFGNFQNVSIKVCKQEDRDGDVRSSDDRSNVQGWSMTLYDNAFQVGSTQLTRADGCYTWTDLGPGNYSVTEELRSGWHNLNSNFGSHGFGVLQSGSGEHSWTFVNTRLGKVIVKKVMVGGTDSFDFTGSVEGTISTNNGTLELNNVIPGSDPTSEESIKTGWNLTDISCEGGRSMEPSLINLADRNVIFRVESGETVTCTFTNTKSGTISGYKYGDSDGSLLTSGDQAPISGWGVTLYQCVGSWTPQTCTTVAGITTTDATGHYSFSNLYGTMYRVIEESRSGWSILSPTNGIMDVGLAAGANASVNFINAEHGSVSGQKYNDFDGDGNKDDGELGLLGWTINLYNETGNGLLATTSTDSQGNYSFSYVQPGNYQVCEINQSGWTNTNPGGGVNSPVCTSMSVTAGRNTTIDFGNFQLGKITACKYNDLTGNGQYEITDDQPLANISIKLSKATNLVDTKETGTNGCVTFEGLTAGNYRIEEDYTDPDLDGYYPTNSITYHDVSISSGSNETKIFLNALYKTISGTKFNDLDGDGVKDAGESVLSGWTIYIDSNFNSQFDLGEESTITDENGYYEFTNLTADTYRIAESMSVSQISSGWTQTLPGTGYYDINVHTNQTAINNDFGNVQLGDIHGFKFNDLDNNGLKDTEEPLLDGWRIFIDSNDNQEFDIGETSTFTSDSSDPSEFGWYWFRNLLPGIYNVCEEIQSGWSQTFPGSVCHEITLPYTQELRLFSVQNAVFAPAYNFGNLQLGSISVAKFNDLNGDGFYDENNEEVLPDWIINLSGDTKVTTNKGVIFDQLLPGDYFLNEIMQVGWSQTVIYCSSEEGGDQSDLVLTSAPNKVFNFLSIPQVNAVADDGSGHLVSVNAGDNITCYIGNKLSTPSATISKSNDSVGNIPPGGAVGYKIKVIISGNDVDNFQVTDLMSDGFTYQSGSYNVLKNGSTYPITEPVYQSPGVWKLGNLKIGDTIEMTYTANISNDQDPGIYTDLAYGYGQTTYGYHEDVLALADIYVGYVDENFVGTEVPVVKNNQNSVSAGVEREEQGEVLGASTELPSTGSNTLWLLVTALMSILGLTLIKKTSKKLTMILIFALFFLFPGNAKAVSNLSLRVEQPKTPTNQQNFDLVFVALDITNAEISVTCAKKGPSDVAFTNFGPVQVLDNGGNTGICHIDSSIVNTAGDYSFRVTAVGSEAKEVVVSINYNNEYPGTPTDYRKEYLNNGCDYKIYFKTADDGGRTSKVELYRADVTSFILDAGSVVASVNIGSNSEHVFSNSVPDCNKSYYYVLRAFNSYGNGSGTVGDSVVKIINPTTTTTTQTTGSVSGAIPVTGVNLPSEEITEEEESLATNEEGQVLGTENLTSTFFAKYWKLLILFLIIIASIVYVALKKRRARY